MRKRGRDRNRINGGFIPFTYEMIDSPAYKKLSGNAIKALVYALRKVKTSDPVDRYASEFKFTYAEAKRCGFCAETFRRALKQLQVHGFLEKTSKGGLRNLGMAPTRYKLSRTWKQTGAVK